ncbi:hypothetical protein K458DRAFT_131696 [Lentithecium fluviatile CBS 122367]|uniref:Uncharacterized protein n=1 Tax=Lentithecium fluviatile CBS 122367 TaxID=1168545 RepID=A0A6G1JHN1_9PLEO|nr:hypothetical protein K458DRAFT_131696 [Lentithecium fluviatile CBS 122367]
MDAFESAFWLKESSSPRCRVGFCAFATRVLILALAGTFLDDEGVGGGWTGSSSRTGCVAPLCRKPGGMETAYRPDCTVRPGGCRREIERSSRPRSPCAVTSTMWRSCLPNCHSVLFQPMNEFTANIY